MPEAEIAPKEQISFKRQEVLMSLADEYKQDRQDANQSLAFLTNGSFSSSNLQETLERALDKMDERIIGAAHGAEHVARVVKLAGEMVRHYEHSENTTLPVWFKMAIGCAAIAHDLGAIPGNHQAQEQAYAGHVVKSADLVKDLADEIDDRDFGAKPDLDDSAAKIDRQDFKDVSCILVMATSTNMNLAFAGYADKVGEEIGANLPIFSLIEKAKVGALNPEEGQTKEERVFAESLLRLAKKFEPENPFWNQLKLGVGIMAAADYGSYQTRRAIIQEKMALFLGFHQVWEAEDGSLTHRSCFARTPEEFALDSGFAKAVKNTYSDFFSPAMKADAERNARIFARINELVSGGFDPCLRVEGGILPGKLLDVAKQFGIESDPEFKTKILKLSDQLLSATEKQPSGFGPMATPVIQAMVKAVDQEKAPLLFKALFLEMAKDMKTNQRESSKIRVHIAPQAYNISAINQIVEAGRAAGIPTVFLTIRQDHQEDLNPEFLSSIAQELVKNSHSGAALSGIMNPQATELILRKMNFLLKADSGAFNLDKIFIHLGTGSQDQHVEQELIATLNLVVGFVKDKPASAPEQRLWLHIDDNFSIFRQWAIDNPNQWQILKDKVQISTSPYSKIIYSHDPVNHEFWQFRDWLKQEHDAEGNAMVLFASTNNINNGAMGFAVQRFMLELD